MKNTELKNNEQQEELSFVQNESAEVGSIDSFFDDIEDVKAQSDGDLFGGGEGNEDILDQIEDDDSEEVVESKGGNTKINLEQDDDIIINSSTSEIINVLVSKGLIDSDLVFEDEEGNEIPLSEANLTSEELGDVVDNLIKDKLKDSNKDKVSTKGISDFTKKLIEIENNGGNVKQALESYEKFKAPMDELDISTVEGQYEAIYLTLEAKGLSEKDIKSLIESYDDKGELEERAKKAKEDLDEAFEKQMQSINDKAAKKKQEWQDFIKKYSTDIKEELDASFELNDTIKKKIVNLASKENAEGKYDLDKIYNDVRRDPKKAAKLALFLFDIEEYNKQVSNQQVDANNRRTFSKMRLSRSNSTPSSSGHIQKRRTKKEVTPSELD